jgi:hypothetical protein
LFAAVIDGVLLDLLAGLLHGLPRTLDFDQSLFELTSYALISNGLAGELT